MLQGESDRAKTGQNLGLRAGSGPLLLAVYRLNFRAPCIGINEGKWEIVIESIGKEGFWKNNFAENWKMNLTQTGKSIWLFPCSKLLHFPLGNARKSFSAILSRKLMNWKKNCGMNNILLKLTRWMMKKVGKFKFPCWLRFRKPFYFFPWTKQFLPLTVILTNISR